MSNLYKRPDSPYFWWTARYNGRRLRKSTGMTQKHLARKVQTQWDLELRLGTMEFHNPKEGNRTEINQYIRQHLKFIETRKSDNTLAIAKGVLKQFRTYLNDQGITSLEDISVTVLDGFIDWLTVSPKTKKNHLGVISRLLDQAIREDILVSNPAKKATLPEITTGEMHRQLDDNDLGIIWEGAGDWLLYYQFLYYTGLRAGDVARLKYGDIDREKKAIMSFVHKSRQIHEFPLAAALLGIIPTGGKAKEPIFPALYSTNEKRVNNNLAKPRKHMQHLLRLKGRPKADLHSFRVTYNNRLRDLGLSIEDRQILLSHSSSETTKIYTHPNFDLAADYVNRIPIIGRDEDQPGGGED